MEAPPQIVWFKRDLRVHDHAPLLRAVEQDAPIIPLYIVEPGYWRQSTASQRHWAFIHDCLVDLDQSLKALGQPLIIRVGEACEVLKSLHYNHRVRTVWAHEETADLWTFRRDNRIREMCRDLGIALNEVPSNGIVRRLKSRDDWSRIRNARMAEPILPKPAILKPFTSCVSECLPQKDDDRFGQTLPTAQQVGGRSAAVRDLNSFLQTRARGYLQHISSPLESDRYCSRLSAHLAWGSLSTREVVHALATRRAQLSPLEKKTFGRNLSAFESRLAWRCHFVQKLEDQPSLETHCMHPAFEGLREDGNREDYFQAWANGQTGFPFIDACMRSLKHQGWITFRMRAMLVSFASYQLWLDWRVTAPYLAGLFTDYEPGIHYSQFQMQSGVTGINSVRIYNPLKQGKDQDPSGTFIREWVPELKNYGMQKLHEPWLASSDLFFEQGTKNKVSYPPPVIDLIKSSKEAKEKIHAVKRSELFKGQSSEVLNKLGSRKRPHRKKHQKHKAVQLNLFN